MKESDSEQIKYGLVELSKSKNRIAELEFQIKSQCEIIESLTRELEDLRNQKALDEQVTITHLAEGIQPTDEDEQISRILKFAEKNDISTDVIGRYLANHAVFLKIHGDEKDYLISDPLIHNYITKGSYCPDSHYFDIQMWLENNFSFPEPIGENNDRQIGYSQAWEDERAKEYNELMRRWE